MHTFGGFRTGLPTRLVPCLITWCLVAACLLIPARCPARPTDPATAQRDDLDQVVTRPTHVKTRKPTGLKLIPALHEPRPFEIDLFEFSSAQVTLQFPNGASEN